MAAFYGMYHGPKGLQEIASRIRLFSYLFSEMAEYLGYHVSKGSGTVFDTVVLDLAKSERCVVKSAEEFAKRAEKEFNCLARVLSPTQVSFSMHEQMNYEEVTHLLNSVLCSMVTDGKGGEVKPDVVRKELLERMEVKEERVMPKEMERSSLFMTHEKFNSFHTEMEL